jgi:hypothetical protein
VEILTEMAITEDITDAQWEQFMRDGYIILGKVLPDDGGK